MASAELSVVYSDDDHDRPTHTAGQPGHALHRIQEVRRLQGMSLRTAARQLGTDIRSIRAQEQATTDLRLTDIYNWQRALEVPISELLVDEEEPLSRPVRERGAMLKIMKSARSIVESANDGPTRRMAENLVEQLLELMPELKQDMAEARIAASIKPDTPRGNCVLMNCGIRSSAFLSISASGMPWVLLKWKMAIPHSAKSVATNTLHSEKTHTLRLADAADGVLK